MSPNLLREKNRIDGSINSKYLHVIEFISQSLSQSKILWALTGSSNHLLQGVKRKPRDIDILSDASGILLIEKHFEAYVIRPVEYSVLTNIRSFFGKLIISGIEIDLMGDIENMLEDGIWEPHTDWEKNIRWLNIDDVFIPVLSLQYEYAIYRKLGKGVQAQRLWERIKELNP